MIRNFVIFFYIVYSLACNKKTANSGKIYFDKITLTYHTMALDHEIGEVDKRTVNSFNRIFEQSSCDCDCIPTGKVRFYLKDSMILDAEFATSNSGSNNECQFLIVYEGGDKKCYQLNYSTGMFLDEIYNELRKR